MLSVEVCTRCGAATVERAELEAVIGPLVDKADIIHPRPAPLTGVPAGRAGIRPANADPTYDPEMATRMRGEPAIGQPVRRAGRDEPALGLRPMPSDEVPTALASEDQTTEEKEATTETLALVSMDDEEFEREITARAVRKKRNVLLLLAAVFGLSLVALSIPAAILVYGTITSFDAADESVAEVAPGTPPEPPPAPAPAPSEPAPQLGASVAATTAEGTPPDPGEATAESAPQAPPEPVPAPTPNPATAAPKAATPTPASPSPAPKSASVQSLVDQGWNVVETDPAKAEGLFKEALSRKSGDAVANLGYAYARIKQNKGGVAANLCLASKTGDTETKREAEAYLDQIGEKCD